MSASTFVDINKPPQIIPVVLPSSPDLSISGRVRNLQVFSKPSTDWIEEDGEGGYIVAAKYAKRGYILLKDAYEQENNHEGWGRYKQYLADWQAGRTTSPFPKDMLPKLVLSRQAGTSGEGKPDPWARSKGAQVDAKKK
jgi:hypothetical protein